MAVAHTRQSARLLEQAPPPPPATPVRFIWETAVSWLPVCTVLSPADSLALLQEKRAYKHNCTVLNKAGTVTTEEFNQSLGEPERALLKAAYDLAGTRSMLTQNELRLAACDDKLFDANCMRPLTKFYGIMMLSRLLWMVVHAGRRARRTGTCAYLGSVQLQGRLGIRRAWEATSLATQEPRLRSDYADQVQRWPAECVRLGSAVDGLQIPYHRLAPLRDGEVPDGDARYTPCGMVLELKVKRRRRYKWVVVQLTKARCALLRGCGRWRGTRT